MNVLLCGVGGQGILLMSDVLAEAARLSGFDVKKSEVHGMSQRGGSVFSHVRWGDEVFSPSIPRGCADFILAFEVIEAARYALFLKRNGKMIAVDKIILPEGVIERGGKEIRRNLMELLGKRLQLVDPGDAARNVGNIKVANTILLRYLADNLDLEPKIWKKAIKNVLPEKIQEINLKAWEI